MLEMSAHTRVSSDVFPEPLRPARRNDGRVVEDVERYITKCRKSGIESTTRAVMIKAKGVGCKSLDNRLCESDQAITAIQDYRQSDGGTCNNVYQIVQGRFRIFSV